GNPVFCPHRLDRRPSAVDRHKLVLSRIRPSGDRILRPRLPARLRRDGRGHGDCRSVRAAGQGGARGDAAAGHGAVLPHFAAIDLLLDQGAGRGFCRHLPAQRIRTEGGLMTPLRVSIFAAVAAAILLVIVFELMRSRRLQERYALLWLLTGLVLFVLAVWRGPPLAGGPLVGSVPTPSPLSALWSLFISPLVRAFLPRVSQRSAAR